MADDLETDLSDTYKPEKGDNGKGNRAYSKLLNDMLRTRYAGQRFRQAGYDRLSSQQLSAEDAIRSNNIGAYGVNNPSGRGAAQVAQLRASMPYGQVDLAARQAGRADVMNVGQAILNKRQMNANIYSTYMNAYLNNKQIENNAALGLAQIEAGIPSAPSSGGGWLESTIGAIGSIASASILSGV